jgi:hypothetical protein
LNNKAIEEGIRARIADIGKLFFLLMIVQNYRLKIIEK